MAFASRFDRAHVPTRADDPQRNERTAEQNAAGATTVADNVDRQFDVVRTSIDAMSDAAAVGDLGGWTTARSCADEAVRQLEHSGRRASATNYDAAPPEVRQRLASVGEVLENARHLVALAPAAPPAAAPTLSCSDALLAALPPDPPPPVWRDVDFQTAADAVTKVVAQQMTSSDIAALRMIVGHHGDHPIVRRFRRFGEERRRRILGLLDRDDVKRSARAREVARRAETAIHARPARAPAPLDPTQIEGTSTRANGDIRAAPSESAALAPPITGESPLHADGPPREALGSAIAARVTGVTYEGSGRFLVSTDTRPVTATIQRVRVGVARVQREADDSAVLAIPTGLDDQALAAAVATQLRELQLQPAARHGGGANGSPLPAGVRGNMESALGAGFSEVRVHDDGEAQAVGALAFTRGADIHFAPGRYDPNSAAGRQLLGHELAHVAQQRQGSVSPTKEVNGHAINDDAALEQEADRKGALAASTTSRAAPLPSQARSAAASVPPTPDEPAGAQPTTSDVTADLHAGAPIQRQRDEHAARKPHIPYRIEITRPMTGEEFKIAAHLQVFGAVIASDWNNVKDAYTPADSPVEILVGVELFRRGRGLANAARGIETDARGAVIGGAERAQDFANTQPSDGKTAIVAEIDRRYFAAIGAAPGSKIKAGDLGRAALWNIIRDEVLFQNAYLSNLPEKVRAVIRASITGRELMPADYDQVFRIAKKVENLPPGQAADYASQVTGQAVSLDALEAAFERYRGGIAAREHQDQQRVEVHNKLLGLEQVYQLYRSYRDAPAEAMGPGVREQLEQQLSRYEFGSIAEFTSYVAKYEPAFEDGAAAIALDILAKYAGKLHRESQRYQDPAVVKALHGKLDRFRAQYQAFDKSSKIESAEAWNAQHERGAELRRLPGNGGIPAAPPTRERISARQKAEAAQAGAEVEIKDLSKDYPIFAEDELPAEKRLDKVALAQASERELAGVLQAHIAHRQAATTEARQRLEGKHELIYKMPKLMPTFYAQLGIQAGSIHDQIIRDKMHSDAVTKIVTGVAVAIVTVALTVVSLGTATPAVLAAGASIGAAGLSTYIAYDEYKHYAEDHAIADAGFAEDPAVLWLVLAIVGAGADAASAVSVVAKLASAARPLGAVTTAAEADGRLIDFTKAVEKLRAAKEIDEKIAAAANKAAAARTCYAAARDQLKADLRIAASGARGALGPFTDPTVFRGLVKMAIAKIREGVHSLDIFIEQLKKARIEAQLGEMSPEELVKAKEAWAQADGLTRQIGDPAQLDRLLALDLEPAALEKFANLDVDVLKRFAALSREELQKFARLRHGDLLSKFGACDVQGLKKLAALERSVLEKFGGWDARTVENISRLSASDIEKIARLKVAPGQALEGALTSFRSEQFRMGSEVFQLDKSGMKHVLERHHPQYWDGSVKLKQSFLDPQMSLEDVQDAIRAVMQQNRDQLIKLGTSLQFQITGTYGGSTYVLGINNGRIAQFYPR